MKTYALLMLNVFFVAGCKEFLNETNAVFLVKEKGLILEEILSPYQNSKLQVKVISAIYSNSHSEIIVAGDILSCDKKGDFLYGEKQRIKSSHEIGIAFDEAKWRREGWFVIPINDLSNILWFNKKIDCLLYMESMLATEDK